MSTVTPTWTKKTAVIAIAMLAKGAVTRGTIDLTNKRGAFITAFVLRSGATAIDVAIQIRARRLHGSATPFLHSGAFFAYTCGKTTAVAGVAAAAGNNAGVASLTLNAAKTFAAGPNGDIMLGVIDDTTTPTLAGIDILRQAFATSTTVKLLEFPTEAAHNNVAHVVTDQAELLTYWIEGGSVVELGIDYGSATTGDSVCVGAYADTYDSDGIV